MGLGVNHEMSYSDLFTDALCPQSLFDRLSDPVKTMAIGLSDGVMCATPVEIINHQQQSTRVDYRLAGIAPALAVYE